MILSFVAQISFSHSSLLFSLTESNSQGRFEARIANLNYLVVRRRNELNARRRELQASIERRESTERLRELTRRASEARDRLRESLEGYGVI